MFELLDLTVIAVLVSALLFVPVGWGRFVLKWGWKLFWYLISSPYYLLMWVHESRAAARRRSNFELLGQYVAALGNNPHTLKYFRTLIENGIREQSLLKLLKNNLQQAEGVHSPEEITEQLEQEQSLRKLAAQQQEILTKSQVSMEQIQFREKLLEQLYHKIRKKYRM